jgi:hypothetical protein
MATQNREILKNLLVAWPPHTVATVAWLETQGVSRFLKRYYVRSGWMRPLGQGAVVRPHETVDWPGGLYALQHQLALPIHMGGKSALTLWGLTHFLQMGMSEFFLFSPPKVLLPSWFRQGPWTQKCVHTASSFLPAKLGITRHTVSELEILLSEPERAALEILHQVPKFFTLSEVDLVFENLTQLRPALLQPLLEQCQSYRVKRLCLFLGERHQQSWFKHLKLSSIDLGKGILQLAPRGTYHPTYKMTLPKEMMPHEPTPLF